VAAPTVRGLGAAGAEHAARAKVSPDEWLARRAHVPIGTPDQVIEKLRAYAELGVGYVIPVFPYGREREMVRVLAERVIPATRAA